MKRKWKNAKQEKRKCENTKRDEKFTNSFGCWIAEDAPPPYHVPLSLKPLNM